MRREQFEVTRGSGNVYWDLGKANPDLRQFKAILATEIIKALDRDRLSIRKARAAPGLPRFFPAFVGLTLVVSRLIA